MNQATAQMTAAFWKMVPLIVTAVFFLAAAGAAGYVLVQQNPQWQKTTRKLVYACLVLVAVGVSALFFFLRVRSGT